MKKYYSSAALLTLMLFTATPAFAQEATAAGAVYLPLAIAFIMGLAIFGGGTAQGRAISAGLDSIGRNPSASGKISATMIIGLAFIESLVIFGFVVSFLLLGRM